MMWFDSYPEYRPTAQGKTLWSVTTTSTTYPHTIDGMKAERKRLKKEIKRMKEIESQQSRYSDSYFPPIFEVICK